MHCLTLSIFLVTSHWQFIALVSDLGGNTGLWVGFCVLTVVEWIVLILNICYVCLCRGNKSGRLSQNGQTEEVRLWFSAKARHGIAFILHLSYFFPDNLWWTWFHCKSWVSRWCRQAVSYAMASLEGAEGASIWAVSGKRALSLLTRLKFDKNFRGSASFDVC